MVRKIFTEFSFQHTKLFKLGMYKSDYVIVAITLIIVLIVGIIRELNINIREKIANKCIVIRWLVYYAMILYLLIFGAYGGQYIPIDPIYANFSGVQYETI